MKIRVMLIAVGMMACLRAAADEVVPDPQSPGETAVSTDGGFHIDVGLDTRFDFDYTRREDDTHSSGFHGRYLNVTVDGSINRYLDFHLRQRLNRFGDMKDDAFGATDWVYIDYHPTPQWILSGGKQVVAIGGMEYDANPINIYFASRFWNNIGCYQFGVSGAYRFNGGCHSVLAQVCNSPYQPIGESCLAYNLMWQGKMGRVSTLWSVNAIEFSPGRWANFIALGTRVDIAGAYAEVDLMNRYSGHSRYWLGDWSAIGKICVAAGRHVDIFAKGGYERFRPELGAEATVDKPFYGIGAEYYPLKGSRDLRLHVVADVTHDNTGVRSTQISAGLKWEVSVFSF